MPGALVILGGEPPSEALLKRFWSSASFRLAADGGANRLIQMGYKPDLILGDLDSLEGRPEGITVKEVSRQSDTDGEKALEELQHRGIKEAVVLGAFGGRMDFTLFNLMLPLRFTDLELSFYHRNEYIFLAPEVCAISGQDGARVSLLPLGGPVKGLSAQGLKWPLESATLEPEGLVSVSNALDGPEALVRHEAGSLMIFVQQPV